MRSCRFIALVFALVWALGCVTPSVPIPPPSPDNMSFDVDAEAGTARFSYAEDLSNANAVVYVFNRDQGEGVITTARADGSVGPTEPFPAIAGDDIVITFELDSQVSSTCVEVRADPGRPIECDL